MLPFIDTPALAIDLPGRGSRPGELDKIRLEDFVAAAVQDLQRYTDGDVVLVGHSMAGITIPGVLERAHELIRHVILVSCAIPRDGTNLLSLFSQQIQEAAALVQPTPAGTTRTEDEVLSGQAYDMSDAQAQFTLNVVVPETYWPIREPVSLAGFEHPVRRTWVKLTGDHTFPPELQTEMALRAGCVDVVEIDSGHMAMVSHPRDLARVINAIGRGARDVDGSSGDAANG
jgi:pimeloyl-ACP methyl ester carboxylesterase